MKLFASGCSFTWGGELFKTLHDSFGYILDEHNTSDINQQRLNVTWPKHLSTLLECSEFHNHSMGCGSNARIVRKAFEFFVPKILAGEDMSEWVVAIQWTEPSRFEFFDEVTNCWAIAKHDVVLFEKNRSFTDTDKEDILHYYTYNNDIVWGNTFFTQITALGNFLKLHGIKYVFTMIHEGFVSPLTETQLKYCNENFVWYKDNIIGCSISNMGVESCELSPHPSELGHRQIADNLYSFLFSQSS